ncbi:MAG: mechanosensitive ion channel [Coxiellaceae bacterium]|nr:mechanosensitive ion channel [Coxiellaceae bacterium]
MKKIIILSVNIVVLLLLCLTAFSADDIKTENTFDVKSANAILAQAKNNLRINSSEANKASSVIGSLSELLDKSESCVSESIDELNDVNQLLKSSKQHRGDNNGEDYRYLSKKKTFYETQLSLCRYYVYRSKEDLVKYKEKVQQFNQDSLLKKSTPIWKLHEGALAVSFQKINTDKLISQSGVEAVGATGLAIILILMALVCCVVFCVHMRGSKRTSHRLLYVCDAIAALFFLIVGSYVNLINAAETDLSSIGVICYAMFVYIGLCALSSYGILHNDDKHWALSLATHLKVKLNRGIVILLTWLFVGYAIRAILINQNMDLQFFELMRTIYITVLSLIVVGMLSSMYSKLYARHQRKSFIFFTRLGLLILLAVLVFLEWIGYHQLAIYCIAGIILTALLVLAAIMASKAINYLSWYFDNANYHLSKWVRKWLGVKFHKKLPELIIISCILYFILFVLFVIGLMMIWQISGNHIDDVVSLVMDGFSFADLRIVPARIILGLISFIVILLFGRVSATIVAKKMQFGGEEDTQVAVSSIIFYTAVAVAILMLLLVIGVNFTGLAIIAGALSVGIGLGLQTIVNNFVSGVILLLEKPIKPGDRIIVGGSEGFVKKVRFRSTQIATLSKEDVIVPNADLVTQQVTNYMFRDRIWRVICQVGVAYGSDVDLVKSVLLEVASQHEDVIQEEPNKPSALFKKFGDSSLQFELWCIIRDVNKKFVVESDLNFAIDQAFRKHNITIAFPQRDVHIKSEG